MSNTEIELMKLCVLTIVDSAGKKIDIQYHEYAGQKTFREYAGDVLHTLGDNFQIYSEKDRHIKIGYKYPQTDIARELLGIRTYKDENGRTESNNSWLFVDKIDPEYKIDNETIQQWLNEEIINIYDIDKTEDDRLLINLGAFKHAMHKKNNYDSEYFYAIGADGQRWYSFAGAKLIYGASKKSIEDLMQAGRITTVEYMKFFNGMSDKVGTVRIKKSALDREYSYKVK